MLGFEHTSLEEDLEQMRKNKCGLENMENFSIYQTPSSHETQINEP